MTKLPDKLENLLYLDCSGTAITKLPGSLENLIDLECYNTKIKNLDVLSDSIKLENLNCGENDIK